MWRHAFPTEHIDVHFNQDYCVFCKTRMITLSIEDRWPLDAARLRREHQKAVDQSIKYVSDCFAAHRQIVSGFYAEDVTFHCCPACGWWCIIKEVQYDTPKMPCMTYLWAAGALASQDFPDLSAPLSLVRSYLCARYDQRFLIDPYRLEDVVASVLKSFGHDVHISSRSHDGGMDIFGMNKSGKPFCVQVKRCRQNIRIEHLRSFVGALILNGQTRGIFVTTSGFTGGSVRLCRQAKIAGIQLKYADAEKLFEMIRAAQLRDFRVECVQDLAVSYAQSVTKLNYGFAMHLNSL